MVLYSFKKCWDLKTTSPVDKGTMYAYVFNPKFFNLPLNTKLSRLLAIFLCSIT